jgi:hypothetical protein
MNDKYQEHSQEAESLMRIAQGMSENYSTQERTEVIAAAQVHATLALAAATRDNNRTTVLYAGEV